MAHHYSPVIDIDDGDDEAAHLESRCNKVRLTACLYDSIPECLRKSWHKDTFRLDD